MAKPCERCKRIRYQITLVFGVMILINFVIRSALNFDTKKSVRDSVLEILKQVKSGNIDPRDSEFSNMSKLTEKIKSLSNYQFDENL